MKLNKKIVIVFILLVCISWIYNLIRREMYVLEEPIFLKEYIECEILKDYTSDDGDSKGYNGTQLSFYFIDNYKDTDYSNNNIDYVSISFPEIDSEVFLSRNKMDGDFEGWNFGQEENYIYSLKFYPYELNVITIDLNTLLLKDGRNFMELLEDKNKISITELSIEKENGEKLMVDIGEVLISLEDYVEKDGMVKFIAGSGGSGGEVNSSKNRYLALEDLEISSINHELINDIMDYGNLKVNNVSLEDIKYPIRILEGEEFNIDYFISEINFNIDKPQIIDIDINIEINNLNGDKDTIKVPYNISHNDIIDSLIKIGNLNKLK